jgi:preprotein translocase subunit SecY
MIGAIKRIFFIPELRMKIAFTLMMLAICRIGAFVPVPGINSELALSVFRSITGGGQNLLQLMDVFSGGAFAKMTIIALGVMPYITASIMMQIVTFIIPSVQRDMKENPDLGRKKIAKWTRLATLGLSMFYSIVYARSILSMNASSPGIILPEITEWTVFSFPLLFYLIVIFTMTTGTLFLMWIGEQITEKGVGNGVSLIITIGILSSFPSTIGSIIRQLNLGSQEVGQLSFTSLLVLCTVFVLIILGTILIIQGQRKIPLQYARRGVSSATAQANSSYIPLKINYAGVIPVIFASALLMFPATIGQFLGPESWFAPITSFLIPGTWVYMIIFCALILLCTYFWTATQFRPDQIASDMKKNGAFIPGIRQGKPTQEFLEQTMNRITFVGATFLAMIAIFPQLVSKFLGVDASISQFFGGTSLLILVGVILDTAKQIESHLLMQRYEGFMSRGRLQGR